MRRAWATPAAWAAAGALLMSGAVASAATNDLPTGSEPVHLDPADFSTTITNPWWPMRPGTRWVYRETSPSGERQRIVVTVTRNTRLIANGITARVVRDVVTEGGQPVEVTDDWYAQDRAGNVWYFGEYTREYEDGRVVSTAGSFEAGVDGAQAGVIMPARPRPGLAYRQEYYAGKAEDSAEVLRVGERVQVPAGRFRGALVTRDINPLGRGSVEYKFFVRGVGPVLAIGISGGDDREELVKVRPGPR